MNLFRPLRFWIAALLTFASPAVAGQAIALLHPCPAEFPSAAHQMAMPDMPGMDTATQATPAAHGHAPASHPSCHCIGCCATPAVVVPPAITIAVIAVDVPRRAAWPVIEAQHHLHPLTDRLPEKTAPPIA